MTQQICPECQGRGLTIQGEVSRDMAADAGEPSMEGMPIPGRCPTCQGDGWILEESEEVPT